MTYVLVYIVVGMAVTWVYFIGKPLLCGERGPEPDYPIREAITLTALWPVAVVLAATSGGVKR